MKVRWRSVFFLSSAMFLLSATVAQAHTRFLAGKLLTPRSTQDGLKTGPCGNVPQVADNLRVKLIALSEIEVDWEETIDHPGWYRLAYSLDGVAGFDEHVLQDKIPDIQGAGIPRKYKTTIKVPDITCAKCSIQLIQVMTEDVNKPRNYYSCADVRIVKEGSTAMVPATPSIKVITVKKKP